MWVVVMIVKYPEITKKVQKEIDEVVPRGTLVSLQDRPK